MAIHVPRVPGAGEETADQPGHRPWGPTVIGGQEPAERSGSGCGGLARLVVSPQFTSGDALPSTDIPVSPRDLLSTWQDSLWSVIFWGAEFSSS